MDIIDSLLYDTDLSDHEPIEGEPSSLAPPPTSVPPPNTLALPPTRVVARPRSKRQRKVRQLLASCDPMSYRVSYAMDGFHFSHCHCQLSRKGLEAQVEAFEFVVENLPHVLLELGTGFSSMKCGDNTYTIDPDAQRMRDFLKRTIRLSEEAQQEIVKRAEYRRLLKVHLESSVDLRRLMRGLALNEWFWMSDRWRALTLKYYKPFSQSKCYAMMNETLQEIETHTLPDSMTKTEIFGWRDAVRLDDDEHYVRFMTHKTIRNADMKQIVDHKWSLYTDGDLYKKAHLGQNCELYHNTVQRISADAMIIQRVAKYQSLKQLTHSLALTFRVQTETGYMIVTRCIDSPQLDGLMNAEGLSLCGSFYWDTFDFADQDARGVTGAIQFTMAGSIGSDNPTYARRWRDEIVIALARYEAQLKGKSVVALLEASENQDAVDTTDSEAVP